jgi:hypothetical protein
MDKSIFVEGIETIQEFRVMDNYLILEFLYETHQAKNDGKFIYDPIVSEPPYTSVKTTHDPYFSHLMNIKIVNPAIGVTIDFEVSKIIQIN